MKTTRRFWLGTSLAVATLVLGLSWASVAQERPKADKAALTFEMFKDEGGDFRWRLKAANGRIVATSGQGYKAKADCQHGIDLIRKEAGKAKVDDQTMP